MCDRLSDSRVPGAAAGESQVMTKDRFSQSDAIRQYMAAFMTVASRAFSSNTVQEELGFSPGASQVWKGES